MASVSKDKSGGRRIQFIAPDGRRKAIRLGDVSKKEATSFKEKVERLVSAAIMAQAPDAETSRWVADLPDSTHGKLAAVGLVRSRASENAALGAFIDGWIARDSGAKENTLENMQQVRRWLVSFFGEEKDIRTITPADAEDWRQHMSEGGLGENTIRRHVGRARQLLKAAIRRGLLTGTNPFDGMAATVRADKRRQFFVTRDDVQKVINACPNTEWKLMVALSRYGGLRCPSEHLALKWGDVNWEQGRIRVPSPKTEHHEGKESRMIPLFPELFPFLRQAFEEAEPGTEYVITRYRDASANLRTHFTRIIEKAGLKPWPKPWHNMRATRQTELAEKYPIHAVCAWMGNSRAVAQEHYLQVTDAHFQQAAQNPAHQASTTPTTASQTTGVSDAESAILVGGGSECEAVGSEKYPRQDSNL